MLQDLRLNPGESTASAFARIDTNGDELVSREELRAAGVPEARANAMLERGDVTGDGLLSLQEMRRLSLVDDESAPRVAIRGTSRPLLYACHGAARAPCLPSKPMQTWLKVTYHVHERPRIVRLKGELMFEPGLNGG